MANESDGDRNEAADEATEGRAALGAPTLREARTRYFADNGFGDDGGYDSPWVHFQLGPLPLPFPNTGSRVRAVRYHDLHHLLTGYRTDLLGEFEISAWELGAGCKDFVAAWVLNLSGMAAGSVLAPKRIFRAFVRGRRSRSLYGDDVETLLARTVAAVRAERVHEPDGVTLVDGLLFVGCFGLGITVGSSLFLALVATGPFLAAWSLLAPRWVARVIAAG